MATTYEAIATVTVGAGGAANIEFTSIPNTFTDLLVKLSGRSTRNDGSVDNLVVTFNSSTTNYSERMLYDSDGTVASANRSSQSSFVYQYVPSASQTASTFGNFEMYIPNYAGSNNKSVSVDSVTENNSSTGIFLNLTASLWANSSAISSIKLDPDSGNFVQYSTATLYGIKNS